ncbi:MAG: hypothetical protein PHU08_05800 [Dehalococcoidales bacterium]|nr:hypothetical protein [Dehalococcoidales bacterium]
MDCSLKDGTYQGNCEFCNLKVDCMLQEALKKLKSLESRVAEITSDPVHSS